MFLKIGLCQGQEALTMILQFGKYRGRDIRDVPEDYLHWIIQQQQKTLEEYRAELARRQAIQDASLSWAERMIQAGFRTLASQYHPDHGGDNDSMRQVNAAHEGLRELLKRSRMT
jgi:hypothetical protein